MTFFWLIFITLMLPVEVRILPTYKVMVDLGLIDTYTGLTLPLMASATATLLFRQFFLTIPGELVEAARVDGAGPWRFFKDILLPLSKTNIAALFVILFIYGWTQYLWPLLVTNRNDMNTIVIALRKMVSFADADTEWHLVMVTCMLAIVPPILVVVLMQRWFVQRPRRNGKMRRADGDSRSEGRAQGLCRRRRSGEGRLHRHSRRQLCVLVGPSGCGKSTLLRMIAGLESISAGTVSIDGKVVNAIGPTERDIAMVFQNYALYPHMKVYDNMAYGLRNRGTPKDEIDRRVQRRRRRRWSCRRCSTAGRASFPAASASASPWAAPSCAIRRSSCSTSRCPTSTPSCAARCGSRSRICSARSASPRSMSRTTSSRR